MQAKYVNVLLRYGQPILLVGTDNGQLRFDLSPNQIVRLFYESSSLIWNHCETILVDMDKRNMANYCAED